MNSVLFRIKLKACQTVAIKDFFALQCDTYFGKNPSYFAMF